MKKFNDILEKAFVEKDFPTILKELTPLVYKNMEYCSPEYKDDIYQELMITIIKIVNDYDFKNNGNLKTYITEKCLY